MTIEKTKRELRLDLITIERAINDAAIASRWEDAGHLTSQLTSTLGQLAILDGQTINPTDGAVMHEKAVVWPVRAGDRPCPHYPSHDERGEV